MYLYNIFMPPTSKKLVEHIASGTFVHACICKSDYLYNIFMPPTSKKLVGHIASGTFVHACICPLCFLMHSITSEPCMLGF